MEHNKTPLAKRLFFYNKDSLKMMIHDHLQVQDTHNSPQIYILHHNYSSELQVVLLTWKKSMRDPIKYSDVFHVIRTKVPQQAWKPHRWRERGRERERERESKGEKIPEYYNMTSIIIIPFCPFVALVGRLFLIRETPCNPCLQKTDCLEYQWHFHPSIM